MGIRVSCPNGHKLNIKSFLAGKRGVCPQCKAKFLIPSEEQRELVSATATNHEVREIPIPQPVADSDPHDPDEKPEKIAANVVTDSTAHRTSDPISEAPHAVWYVRPPSGGQFGPATGDVMRTWIGEGRVTPDSIIWRQGWTEWQEAGIVFPALHANAELVDSLSVTDHNFAEEQRPAVVPVPPTQARFRQQRTKKKSETFMVAMLAIACLVLFGVLMFVINRGS